MEELTKEQRMFLKMERRLASLREQERIALEKKQLEKDVYDLCESPDLVSVRYMSGILRFELKSERRDIPVNANVLVKEY